MEASCLLRFLVFILVSFISGTKSITFTFKNNCSYKIWPGILTASGSPQIGSTGFELAAGASFTVDAPPKWSGRFWARTQCARNAEGRFTCATGDCGSGQVACNGAGGAPPATLVEITLNGYGGADFYDVSLVDGFNIPVALTPRRVGCNGTSCPENVNEGCPSELAVRGGGGGKAIACKSACLAFGVSEYCCTGGHSTAKTCPPTNYSKMFKRRCPMAYTYAYDDDTSTFTCPSGANYFVTFCP